MWRVRIGIALICSAAAAAAAAAAQDPQPARAQTITIAQAIDEAIAHNLSLLAERSNLAVADAAALTARLRPNPVVSFSADHLDVLGTGFDTTNNGGPPEIALRVDVPIERGGKRDARMAAAALLRSGAEADFADVVRSLRLDVENACIDVLAARAARALVGDDLRTFEDLARVNQVRVTAGSIAPFEATRSQVAMLQFRSQVVRADLDLAAANARLRLLLGRSVSDPVDLAGDLRSIPAAPPAVERVRQLALDSRPDYRSLQLAQARSVADLRLQEALGKIDLTVGTEYRRQQGIAGRSNSLGIFLSAPLPIANRNQGEIARATAEGTQAERQIAARRAQVLSEVETAYQEYVTTQEMVGGIERDLLKPATSARDISTYTYKSGGTTLLELLDSQRAFNDTMRSYLDAQASLRRAASRLNAAVGTEVIP